MRQLCSARCAWPARHGMWSLNVWWQNLYVRVTLILSAVEAASSGLSRAGAADIGWSSLCRDLTFS